MIRIVILATFIASLLFAPIRINRSENVPYTIFLAKEADSKSLERGMIVSFYHIQASIPIAKELVGLPGDPIFLNLAELREKGKSGQPLHPIRESSVPEGYLFVRGWHPDSYDSRYAEFGLVSINNVKEMLWPMF